MKALNKGRQPTIFKRVRFSALIFFMVMLFSIAGYLLMKNNMLKNAQQLGDALSRSYSSDYQNHLKFYEMMLSFGAYTVNSIDQEQMSISVKTKRILMYFEMLQSIFGKGIVDPYLVKGSQIIALNPWDGDEEYDFSNAEWYKLAEQHPDRAVFTDLYTDAISGNPIITIARRCDSGSILAFDIFPENLKSTYRELDLPEAGSFFICDRTGAIIHAQTDAGVDEETIQKYVRNLFTLIHEQDMSGYSASIMDLNNRQSGIYYYEMPNGWLSMITIPFKTIFGGLELFKSVFLVLFLITVTGMGILTWRDMCNWRRFKRTNEAIRVLGNSYYAIYRIDIVQKTYEMIKASDLVRSRLPSKGDYEALMDVLCEVVESDCLQEYRDNFSLQNMQRLVSHRIRDFGGDFRRRFGDRYHWVSVRVLFDESLAPGEVILCFRMIDQEKQKEFQERRLIEASLEKSKQSEKAKQAFFSNMSHEMRTPLNAIVNLSELAEQAAGDPERIRNYLKKINLSSRHMLQLVNEILELSSLEQGRTEVASHPMNLPRCLEDSMEPFRIQAARDGKPFTYECHLEQAQVMGDELRLTQIMNNLLSNALKFTEPGDSVSVRVSQLTQQGNPQYKIIVSDTGKGMSPEFLGRLFEPYSRESRFSSRITGTGLGMPIVKKLVELMNGHINVESTPDVGTTFTIILPFLLAQQPAVPESVPAPRKEESGVSLAGKRILLVEDNAINMEVADEILSCNDMKVEQAWNGREAVEAFRKSEPYHFDVILMDMQMPEMDGCEAARCIRALNRPDARSVPIIAVTANAFAEDIAATTEAGMDGHVSKPIDFPMLFVTLKDVLSRKGGGEAGPKLGG